MANTEQALATVLQMLYVTRKVEMAAEVKVALIGQPGAGKSSLINKLVGKKVFEVGVHTDTTVEKQEKKISDSLIIVDLPGYGTKRFTIESWLEEFKPEQYDLYLFVFSGKLHDADATLFQNLKKWRDEREHPFFIVRNKEDEIWDDDKSLEELKAEITKDVCSRMKSYAEKVYFTSCRRNTGIAELKEAIFNSDIPKVKKSKLMVEFKALSQKDLERKRQICIERLDYYAYAGAVNAINPLPGVDIAVDFGMIQMMFSDFRSIFGIDEEVVEKTLTMYEVALPIAQRFGVPAAKTIFNWATKEGLTMLLKKFGKEQLAKEIGKYIPVVGWALAAGLGYKMIVWAGEKYIDNCFEVAGNYLEYFAVNK